MAWARERERRCHNGKGLNFSGWLADIPFEEIDRQPTGIDLVTICR
jgi:hypothetical protein